MSFSLSKNKGPRSYAACSDVGKVREHNEDSYLVQSPLFVVADGMGGHEAGEVASSIAIKTMQGLIPKSADAEALAHAVIQANEDVLRGAKDGTGKPGMGTTMTAALIYGDDVAVAQVGDSRAYLLRDGELSRITRDHSLVAELIEQGSISEADARFHPQRSVITRALGSDPYMQPDTYTLKAKDGDRIMLCSDGLCSMIGDADIADVMRANPAPDACCGALVDEAILAGGLDNVTVIVIDPLGEPEQNADSSAVPQDNPAGEVTDAGINQHENAKPKHSKRKHKGRFAPLVWAIAFVVILIAAGLGFYFYAQNSYYIIAEDGIVNVYRGLPGHVAGVSASWLEQSAQDIDIDKLTPSTQGRLNNGIAVNSLDEADELLSEYRQASNRS